ncbi:MAG: ADP-ribose pyrophosphatase [Candidatus Hydrogenedentes bacterium ADurb.Bin101]|nr:MAG: ADP-ribose pyrophosphatase [Candidatus Hydrogenedentes bacterium ADurb.Bin101]HOC68893.1 NUDIX hydrolase [Candidatus Hydrogenedentota bacterium]
MERWKHSTVNFDGKILRLRTGCVVLDDGIEAYREVVEHPGGACVLPFTGDAFVLVRQYRIALAQYVLEAPAGKLESGETPEACAIKELREETGYRGLNMMSLGKVFPSVGFSSEVIHLYLATGLESVGKQPEPDERIEIVTLSVEEVRMMLNKHELHDAKTHVVVHRALNHLRLY